VKHIALTAKRFPVGCYVAVLSTVNAMLGNYKEVVAVQR
jgi:hypothetical protein